MKVEDELTKVIRNVTLALGAAHPIRFGVAAFTGVALKGFVITAAPSSNSAWLLAASNLHICYYLCLCLAFAFSMLFLTKDVGASEELKSHLNQIEGLIQRSGLSEVEQRQFWRQVLHRYLENPPPTTRNAATKPRRSRKADTESSIDSGMESPIGEKTQ